MKACVWFPNWPIQRLLSARPKLGRPLALFDQRRKIVASSIADVVGLPVAEVEGLHLEQHDPQTDRRALEQLALWCEQFGPIIGIELDSIFLDVTGLPFDVEQVSKMIGAQGFEARSATAETIGAAWALAHYSEPLPVAALRLPTETVELLHELGIRHIAELKALPRDRVATRFPEVIVRLDQFTGFLPEPITAQWERPKVVVQRDLEYPLDRHELVEAVLAAVVEQISAELASQQQGAIRIEFVLRCQSGEARIVVGLFQASARATYLLELLLLQLKRLPGPLIAARATVQISAPLGVRQRELFDDHYDRQRQLALFVDRISSRSPALRAVLVADDQPEHAFRYEPLTSRKRSPSKSASRPRWLKRPLLVEPRPIPIDVIATDGIPAQFCFHGRSYRITRRWGPERIQTGWWRNGYNRRDYFRVQTDDGCFWLFCSQGKWFLHGVFD